MPYLWRNGALLLRKRIGLTIHFLMEDRMTERKIVFLRWFLKRHGRYEVEWWGWSCWGPHNPENRRPVAEWIVMTFLMFNRRRYSAEPVEHCHSRGKMRPEPDLCEPCAQAWPMQASCETTEGELLSLDTVRTQRSGLKEILGRRQKWI